MASNYEISDELNRRHVNCLEKKYGGRLRAHSAAIKIQRAFRIHQLQKHFKSTVNRDSLNGNRPTDSRNAANTMTRYQPMNSLRAQLAQKNGQTTTHSPRKNSTPCAEKVNGEHNEMMMSPRLSQRHVFSTTNSRCTGGTSPVVWVQSRCVTTVGINAIPFTTPSTSSSSLTPNDSANLSPAHRNVYQTHSLPRMVEGRNSSSSASSDMNFVQIDSMMLVRGTSKVRECHPDVFSPMHHRLTHSATTSSTSTANDSESNGAANGDTSTASLEQQRRRMYRVALNMFNKKPERGLRFLIDWRFVDDHPESVAKFLKTRRGVSKKQIGELLGTLRSDYHLQVLDAVLKEIPMNELGIDEAIRAMVHVFQLPTEAQKIDHVMQVFARHYRNANISRLADVTTDGIYVLAFAVIMLNTDLHSPSIRAAQKMTAEQFVRNTRNAEDSRYFDEELLLDIYNRIKDNEIRAGADHCTQVFRVDQTITGRDKPRLVEPHRRLICYCRVNQIASPQKRQSANAHQRDIFLFNDLILITKTVNTRKDAPQYTLRHWSPLLGLRIDEAKIDGYEFALRLILPNGTHLYLNAKNSSDRSRFIADVQESVAECDEMERIRIGLELRRRVNPPFQNEKDELVRELEAEHLNGAA
ncbi:SEC7 domain-containing protein [Aphelenchoides besseyi]|nr:SEC7 domain-containing protein [Aphelenchoides besseyi]KAI6236533.1 SEC7 domain-containing protein [Aphelenchoides besseyi]